MHRIGQDPGPGILQRRNSTKCSNKTSSSQKRTNGESHSIRPRKDGLVQYFVDRQKLDATKLSETPSRYQVWTSVMPRWVRQLSFRRLTRAPAWKTEIYPKDRGRPRLQAARTSSSLQERHLVSAMPKHISKTDVSYTNVRELEAGSRVSRRFGRPFKNHEGLYVAVAAGPNTTTRDTGVAPKLKNIPSWQKVLMISSTLSALQEMENPNTTISAIKELKNAVNQK